MLAFDSVYYVMICWHAFTWVEAPGLAQLVCIYPSCAACIHAALMANLHNIQWPPSCMIMLTVTNRVGYHSLDPAE